MIFIIFLQLQVQPHTVTILSFQPRVIPFYHTWKVFIGVKPKIFCKLKFSNKTLKQEKRHLTF